MENDQNNKLSESDVMKSAHESLSRLYEKCGMANEIAVMEAEERRLIREQAFRKTHQK